MSLAEELRMATVNAVVVRDRDDHGIARTIAPRITDGLEKKLRKAAAECKNRYRVNIAEYIRYGWWGQHTYGSGVAFYVAEELKTWCRQNGLEFGYIPEETRGVLLFDLSGPMYEFEFRW